MRITHCFSLCLLSAMSLVAQAKPTHELNGTAAPAKPAASAAAPLDLWVYAKPDVVLDLAAQKELVKFASHHAVRRLYVSAGAAISKHPEELAAFVRAAHAASLEVQFLFGSPEWALPENRAEKLKVVQAVVDFAAAHKDAAPAGIHFDIEPHLETSQTKDEINTIANGYLDVMEATQKLTAAAHLTLAADVSVGWPKFNIARNGKTHTFTEWILQYTDGIGLMSYRNTAAKVEQIIAPLLTEASAAHKKAVIGLSANCNPAQPASVSFCKQGAGAMKKVMHQIQDATQAQPAFDGFAIFTYEYFAALSP